MRPHQTPFCLGIAPDHLSFAAPLCLGSTPLGFAFEDISALFAPGIAMVSLEAIKLLCPKLLLSAACPLQALCKDLRQQCGCGDLSCYTDGSFTPGSDNRPTLCGWACVFIDPHAGSIGAIYGSYPSYLCPPTELVSPFLGEVSGLLAAALGSMAVFQDRLIHFRSDCTSALAIAEGCCGFQPAGLSLSMRQAFAFRQSLSCVGDSYAYVPGHTGQLGNEIADVLSKAGAQLCTPSCGLMASRAMQSFWLGPGEVRLSWAAMAIRIGRGDATLPPLNNSDLGHDGYHAGLTARQFLAPFLPPGLVEDNPPDGSSVVGTKRPRPAEATPTVCHLRVASFNVLSLGAALETDDGSATQNDGIAFRPGRAQILATQLKEEGVCAACLQETRCEAGRIRTNGYIRLCSGASRGQWGVEWWFLDNHPLLVLPHPGSLPVSRSLCSLLSLLSHAGCLSVVFAHRCVSCL